MTHVPLPEDRIVLAQNLSEPAFGRDADDLFYVRSADGRRSVVRHDLATGLARAVTTEPMPTGGVGYGGALFAVRGERLVYAGKDGRLHAVDLPDGRQRPITPAYEGVAAPAVSPCGRFVLFLAEHEGRCDVRAASLDGEAEPVRLSDAPWYAFNPVVAGDGARVAWMEWSEHDMPWDECRVRIARLGVPLGAARGLADVRVASIVTVGAPRVSVASPLFAPDGARLALTSDESGWRSLCFASPDGARLTRRDLGEGEIGRPDWMPGALPYRFSEDGGTLFVVRRHRSRDTLWRVPVAGGAARELPTSMSRIDALAVRGERLALLGSSPTAPTYVATLDLASRVETPRATSAVGVIATESLSRPEVLSWPTGDGADAWGILYPAAGPEAARRPRPTLLLVHGGPTSEVAVGWYLGPFPDPQYFATRGWHVLCVNHRGGTGYGRAYQEALRERWGDVDQVDYRTGAEHLVARGLADPARLVIAGASAGGYATLLALTRDPEFWAAGVSLFGVGDLLALAGASHRFEKNYEWSLIGPLPETEARWRERSPLT
ncbi:MAG: S9 family peptidase, partial [Hyphomicrobiales bacterium]